MDLSLLQALDRERVLEVLQRDKLLRTVEEERIRRMKHELQELRRKGAKSFARQYSERTCARCQRPLGKFWNSGAVCRGCSHRTCTKCRVGVGAADWKCTVCHAYREIKIRSGEWFLAERAKKYPVTTDRHETVGEKLLNSYNILSHISIVPPTPPPYLDCPSFNRSGNLKNFKPFTKSMEDLMVSFTSHIRKISMSQNDVQGDQSLLRVESGRRHSGQKSLSDTDINKSTSLTKVPSLPNLFRKSKDSDQEGSSTGAEEEASLSSGYSGGKRGSNSSISTDCGLFESSSVTGDLEMALAYNSNTSCLEITVSACRNLTYGDCKRKKCHPYVKIYLLPEKTQSGKLKTTVKRNTTDPVYDEVLKYHIERPLLCGRTLQASVWHSGTLKRKVFLGQVLISLEGWSFEERASRRLAWYPLCPKPESPEGGAVEQDRGEMLVRIKLSSECETSSISTNHGVSAGPHGSDRLTVLINGTKLLPFKANTSQNTYVKGCLTLRGGRELSQTTAVLREKPSSEAFHRLEFDGLSASELQDSFLTLDLWDQTPSSLSDRPLGGVRMDSGKSGSPWQPVLQMPNKWHDFSLPILASVNSRRT